MKRCPTCKQTKADEEFNKCQGRYDGLNWQCRDCSHNRDAEYRKTEHAKEVSRAKFTRYRKQDPEGFKRSERDKMRNWRENNPEKAKDAYAKQYWKDPKLARLKTYKWQLKNWYGISHEKYLELLKNQNGCCAICGDAMKPPYNDHDHKTGKFRGLVCMHCNFALGHARDSVRILENMIKYLKQHSGGTEGKSQ